MAVKSTTTKKLTNEALEALLNELYSLDQE